MSEEIAKVVINVDPEIKDLIPEYIENRKKDIAIIYNYLKQNDFSPIQSLGHKMRGSGKLYGFEQISHLGHSLEQAAKTDNKELIEKLCEQLKTFLETMEVR